jgi:hypothetical protein
LITSLQQTKSAGTKPFGLLRHLALAYILIFTHIHSVVQYYHHTYPSSRYFLSFRSSLQVIGRFTVHSSPGGHGRLCSVSNM